MLLWNYFFILKMLTLCILRVKILTVGSLKRLTERIFQISKRFYSTKIFDSDFIKKKTSTNFWNYQRICRKYLFKIIIHLMTKTPLNVSEKFWDQEEDKLKFRLFKWRPTWRWLSWLSVKRYRARYSATIQTFIISPSLLGSLWHVASLNNFCLPYGQPYIIHYCFNCRKSDSTTVCRMILRFPCFLISDALYSTVRRLLTEQ
jgi:hypothetical protein